MSQHLQRHISGRLSLRSPQAEALARLVRAIKAAPELLGHERDLAASLTRLQAEFPTLQDFERAFPSLCFALATGVGKTRLMGAFIAYLHLAHGINNFFVLAPNLTIYNKLITDFTRNTPKYVFRGIAELAQQPPMIITGDNYEQSGVVVDTQALEFKPDLRVNIFNIAKINSEVRGGKEPRIKRMREVLGDSYFNHLASLPDLVLLMDESHRYRAQAGMKAINELKPLFGLEVTATPFVESNKGPVPFKNVVMDYPLAKAMDDGFVKEPAVVTQRHFKASAHTPEELETIKLEDGVRLHEITKVELLTYARDQGVTPVKPLMLVIARDTTHASALKTLLESVAFRDGLYAGKVIQVDSSRSGAEEEEMIARLLAVESRDEPTEIVIHVNMLKEGWDVTNLYTIVPLRAAHARTLIEQSIGRGLRLPYGKRTGVAAVDRLNIIAHERFQEIIDEANRPDSPIRLQQLILDAPSGDDAKLSVQVSCNTMTALGLGAAPASLPASVNPLPAASVVPVFSSEAEKQVAQLVLSQIRQYETQSAVVPASSGLLQPQIQQQLCQAVSAQLQAQSGGQGDLLAASGQSTPAVDIADVVAKTTQILITQSIDIPRIVVVPTGEVTTGFHPFDLDVSLLHLQPGEREILGQMLHSNQQFSLAAELGLTEQRPEDYIVHALIDFDDIDYFTLAERLYQLAGQMVQHLRSYLSEDDCLQVLARDRRLIAQEIHSQMRAHFWQSATQYEVQVNQGFSALKACHYTAAAGQPVRYYRDTLTEPGRIRQMLFGGFSRCLYSLQKFDSDTERRFAVILERDALKWFKPAKGQFQIFYQWGAQQPEYIPDFVAETESMILMIETKARGELETAEVQAKATAALRWCGHASGYTASVGGKAWRYLLIPHDEVKESRQLPDFLQFEVK